MRKMIFAALIAGLAISSSAYAIIKNLGAVQYSFSSGAPNSRSLSLATAYQATDVSKPALVTVDLTSTAVINLSGGQTHSADIIIGSTNAVASGTGTVVGRYSNASTGTVVVGLSMSTTEANTVSFVLPIGWYFAVRQTSGTVTITSAFDQSLG